MHHSSTSNRAAAIHDRTVFFGPQAILKGYLAKRVTHADVEEARDLFAAYGESFNETGWRDLVERHGALLRVRSAC